MKKSISLLLAVMMVLTLFVGMVPAASAEDTNPDPDGNGLVTSKVYDPATGKLTIEAYATGSTVTTVTEKAKPCDIVLVLDVSGSMDETIKIGNVNNLDQLDKELGATRGFYQVDVKLLVTVTRDLQYRDGRWQWYNETRNKWLDIGSGDFKLSNIYMTKMNALKSATYKFINTVYTEAAANNVDHQISIVKFAGTKSTSVGNQMYNDNSYNYSQIVTQLTDVRSGSSTLKATVNALKEGGATSADYGMQHAQSIIDNIPTTRNSNKVVVMFTDGEPNHNNGFSDTVANDTIKAAKAMKDKGVSVYTIGVFGSTPKSTDNVWKYMNGVSSNYPNATSYTNLGAGKDLGYYKTAASSMEMDEIFKTIAEESTSGGSKIELNSSAKLIDYVTGFFDLPENAAGEIKVHTETYKGNNTWTNDNDYNAYTPTVDVDKKQITVTGFNYAEYYVGVDKTTSGDVPRGQKLVVEIPITPNATIDASGTYPTNTGESGIYDGNGNSVEKLPVPEIKVAEETYVIDYAKAVTVNSKDWDQDRIDGIYDKVGSDNDPNMTYGDVSKTSTTITYTPKTMEWDGADTLYSYYNTSDTDHIWAKVNFVPANNVYYEDDFATISYNDTWTTDGRSTNQQEFANSIHGGVDNSTLVDDTTYSDGSAHKAVASKDKLPSASFTFTGTGVDVYSRTNSETGTVMAVLSGNGVNKVMTVDNLLKQGKDFYQVPTVSFADLPYGTYTVTIYVSTAAGDRVTYYLDGVRVYNPTQDTTLYDVSERNAQFVEVRDLLIDADDFGVKEGIVFTDNGNAFDVATYKKYGPENEVYLAKGQAIMFQVNNVGSGTDYYIGMSAPEGSATAKMTNGASASEKTVGHASDLYYKVTPNADGFVIIENTGDNMLAISKLRVAGEVPVTLFAMAKAPMMSYANSFSTLSVVPYEEEAVDPVVDPTDPIVDPIVDPEPTPDPEPTHTSIFENLFKFIKNLFSWR